MNDICYIYKYSKSDLFQWFLHRAGRCGRAGKAGLVVNFATPQTKFVIRRFGKQLGVKVLDCEIRDGKIFLRKP